MMDIRPMFTRRLSVQGDTAHFSPTVSTCVLSRSWTMRYTRT